MKNHFILFAILLCFTACSKKDSDTLAIAGNGCIERIQIKQEAHQIAAADYTKTIRIFQQNNIDARNLRFLQYDEENLVVNGVNNQYVHIKVAQYDKGLPFFYGDVSYHFKDGNFYLLSGNKLATALDSTAHLPLATVRALYFKEFAEYNKQRTYYEAADFADKCVAAELGYYRISATNTPVKIARAWRVTPKGQEYPVAYINDENSTTIYFFDGIINFLK